MAYIAPYWPRLVPVVAISLFSTLLGLAQPYISKLLIDEALLRRNMQALVAVSGFMMGITVLGFVLSILSSYRYVRVSAEVLFDMRLAVYRRLQALSPRFYARTRLGDIVSRINNDISEIQRVSADAILALVNNVVVLAGSVVIMLWLNWKLFLLSIVLLPASMLSLRYYQRRLAGQVSVMRERSADIGSFLIETLQGMRLVATSGAEAHEVNRFRERNGGFVQALLSMQLTSYFAGAIPGTILAISTAILFLYGGKLVIDGAMTIGTLVAILAYHARLLGPVQSILSVHTSLVTGAVSLGRVFELLDTPIEVSDRPDAAPLVEAQGAITFKAVNFRYDAETPVLDNVSFHVPAGSICAIVGPSGAGKSTIADLMLRLYDPDSGSVQLDGRDLRDLSFADLRRTIALVDQSPHLFHASIRDNIAYACPHASDAQIIAAADAAALHDFITTLPEGYNTLVGERGLTLSAGQRQRISIARALLRRPKVLVLDEPTASLDAAAEKSISESLAGLIRGQTAIIITHRPSLAEIADQVITLDSGKVAAKAVEAVCLSKA